MRSHRKILSKLGSRVLGFTRLALQQKGAFKEAIETLRAEYGIDVDDLDHHANESYDERVRRLMDDETLHARVEQIALDFEELGPCMAPSLHRYIVTGALPLKKDPNPEGLILEIDFKDHELRFILGPNTVKEDLLEGWCLRQSWV